MALRILSSGRRGPFNARGTFCFGRFRKAAGWPASSTRESRVDQGISCRTEAGYRCIKAGDNCIEAGDSYIKAGGNCIKAGGNYTEAGDSYMEASGSHAKTGDSYIEAGDSYTEAGDSYIEAGDSYIEAGDNCIISNPDKHRHPPHGYVDAEVEAIKRSVRLDISQVEPGVVGTALECTPRQAPVPLRFNVLIGAVVQDLRASLDLSGLQTRFSRFRLSAKVYPIPS